MTPSDTHENENAPSHISGLGPYINDEIGNKGRFEVGGIDASPLY